MAEINAVFDIAYSNMLTHLAQQKDGSRLMRTVGQVKTNVTGKMAYFDRVGSIEMTEVTTRHGDTDYGEDNYSRRAAVMRTFAKGVLVDEEDEIRTLLDPQNAQTTRLKYALGRRLDDSFISAIEGNVLVTTSSGTDETQTATAIPTAQKITAASTGLTLAKLKSAKYILDSVDAPDDNRFVICTAKQLQNLLGVTEIIDVDYATVKALVQGQVNTFLGFEFVRTQRLTNNFAGVSGIRACYAYQANAMGAAIGMEARARSDKLPTKNYATGVHVKMAHAFVRVEDELMVQILCDEGV